MTDSATRLGAALADRYRVERELGAGGMATVFLAHDLKHQRDVAIKVLHPDLGAALGGERFLSEIRTTARLQHPHILPLLDSGEADGLLYYVMPLVTGETLRARIQRERQLRIADAVRIATEVASALDYAHRQGVIHRDIKPENILLHEGQALVADFGIALAVQQAGGARMTQTGLSLGTPHYMSPEQAMGDKHVDARADVYALGAVLYEMLAGDPPFTGSSVQAIVARVLSEKVPPIHIVRDTVPPHVEAAVLTALAKLPADRWGSAREFAEALAAGGGGRAATPTVAMPAAGGPRPGAARRWPVLLATLAGAAALAATWVVARRTGQAADTGVRVLRFPLEPAPGTRVAFPVSGIATFIALSPDGRQAVYAASREGTDWSLHLRRLDELHGRPLPGTDGARHPEFSPDGRWIAFGAPDGSIRKLTVQGTDLTTVTQADQGGLSGITWLTADELVFTRDSRGKPGLWRVPAAGGQPIQFSRIDTAAGEQLQLAPRAADGGRLVFYSSTRSGTLDLRVGVASTETGLAKVFPTLPGSRVLGLMSGHVVYVRSDGALMAVPFDARTWQVGEPLQILDSVTSRWWMTPAALSASGSLLYQRGGMASRIVRVDERGTARPLFEASGLYNHPRLSPDGRRLAIEVQDSRGNNIWVTDLASQATERLTREGVSERPEWSPDGRSLLYVSSRTNDNSLWLQPADGSGPAELLLESATTTTIREGVFAPDGRGVLFRQDTPDSNRDVLLLPLAGDRTPVPLLTSIDDDKHPRVSPDGRWLAYVSNRSGTEEVYVGPMSGTGARVAVSSGGGAEPLWAPDGTHLYFRTGARLVRARIATSPALAVLARDTLFEGPYITDPWHPNYDVTPDGRSFIMLQPVDENRRLVMIVNWVEELRQRTRAGQ
ncbi:MAG TPA: protein kinase [Gemmatimonadales bacterium]|nr:protein kinase [Gemmatimonadales bacterium]